MMPPDDATLIRLCLQGDTKAFEGLIDKYQKTIFNVALRMLNDAQDAEDVAQAVFIKVFEKLDAYNPRHKFFSWLYRMVVNESLNFLNQKKRFEGLDEGLLSAEEMPDERYERHETAEQIGNALMQLEPGERALIVLKHFQELSYKEIAFIFEIPEKTVKSRLFSARQLLKTVLLEQGFFTHE
jgi:RNA polymerase sigma-70 factor (ECF subfamily)